MKHGLLLFTSGVILFATLFILSAPVQNRSMLSQVSFGYPYAFLSRDFNSTDGFLYFPSSYRFSFDFQKYPLSGFSFSHFLADFCIIFGIIEAIVFILEKCKEFFVNRKIWPYSNRNWLYMTLIFFLGLFLIMGSSFNEKSTSFYGWIFQITAVDRTESESFQWQRWVNEL